MGLVNTVKQCADIANAAFKMVLGETAITVNEDLSNLVDAGKAILNADDGIDNYVKAMLHTIGRMQFVDREYRSLAPDVYRDAWEYGAVKAKIRMEPPTATDDPAWNLQNGQSYDNQIFYQPVIHERLWDQSVVKMIPISIAGDQLVKGSLTNANDLQRFIAMIEMQIKNTRIIQNDALIMRTICNFASEVVYSEYPSAAYTGSSGVRAVNLLYKYNHSPQAPSTALTADKALGDKGFLRYCAQIMDNYIRYIGDMSVLFNVEGTNKFTPRDLLHVVLLKDFESAVTKNMQSDTFHLNLVELPYHDTVTCWQGTGTSLAFDDLSKISVKNSEGHDVTVTKVVGLMWDRDALGVCNYTDRIRTHVNQIGDFYNNYYKYKTSFFNAFDENFVVFFIA